MEEHDIYIVGTGIKWIEHITLEVDKVLSSCNSILYVERAPGIDRYFSQKADKVVDLTSLYAENKDRMETYRDMATQVVQEALDNPPVAFALYGHPTIYSYPPFLVKEMSNALGLSVKVLPGVSSLDTLFCDLLVDPAVNGIQMFEATDLILREHQISPNLSTVIWQIGSLGTSLFSSAKSESKRFDGFVDYLKKFYPGEHPVFAVYTQPHPMLKSQVNKFPLNKLPEFAEVLHSAVTLYLPPLRPNSVKNAQLAAQLIDQQSLASVTKAIND